MAHAGIYAVMLPFVIDLSLESHKEVKDIAETLLRRIKRKKTRTVHNTVLQLGVTQGQQSPSSVKWVDDSVLYITCHGNSTVIGPITGDVNITPEQLASAMVGKIPKSLSHLKIMTCHSGSDYLTASSFVSKLCTSLHSSGFDQLTVYGYCGFTGEIGKKPKHSYVTEKKEDSRKYRAKQARVAVKGAEGKAIAVPTAKLFTEEED